MRGNVEVHVPEEGAKKELAVSRFGPGKLFGDIAVLADERRRTRAVALAPTTLLVISRDTLYNVVRYHPLIGSRIFYNLSIDVSCRWVGFIDRVRSQGADGAGNNRTKG